MRVPAEDVDDLHKVLVTWASPACDGARRLLIEQFQPAILQTGEVWAEDVAAGAARAVVDLDLSRSVAAQAIQEGKGPTDPQVSLVELHKAYQAMVEWIERGFNRYGVLNSNWDVYRQWRDDDQKFIDHLRDAAGAPNRRNMHSRLAGTYREDLRRQMPDGKGTSRTTGTLTVTPTTATEGVTIIEASYGIPNQWRDETQRVRDHVAANGGRMSLVVSNDTFPPDPILKVGKVLRVVYEEDGQRHTKDFPEGSIAELP